MYKEKSERKAHTWEEIRDMVKYKKEKAERGASGNDGLLMFEGKPLHSMPTPHNPRKKK